MMRKRNNNRPGQGPTSVSSVRTCLVVLVAVVSLLPAMDGFSSASTSTPALRITSSQTSHCKLSLRQPLAPLFQSQSPVPSVFATLSSSSQRWSNQGSAEDSHRIDDASGAVSSDGAGPGRTGWKHFPLWRWAISATLAVSVMSSTATVCPPIPPMHLFSFGRDVPAAVVIPSSSTAAAWALSPEQLLVDDAWREVSRQFVDPTFAGMGEDGWKRQRQQAMEAVAELGPDDEEQVYATIRRMLSTLKDPYTRFLTPEQFKALTAAYAPSSSSSTAAPSAGIGVQLVSDNGGGSGSGAGGVVVANTLPQSPAAKVGILSGDVIRSIDGVDMTGATAEAAAAKCRGEVGTAVQIVLERGGEDEGRNIGAKVQTITVTRAPLAATAVVESSMETSSTTGTRLGILTIHSFTQETATKVEDELKRLLGGSDGPCSVIVVDLRGNVGGYMPAGVDVAKLFLPPRARIISEVDRTGRATIYINDGVGSETGLPLYVLVDKRTASASEIFTVAVQDNQRATVVGGERTFGKGRIQNVQALSSGSGIAITKAKYLSPNGRDIHNVGIPPDIESKTCSPNDTAVKCLEGIV